MQIMQIKARSDAKKEKLAVTRDQAIMLEGALDTLGKTDPNDKANFKLASEAAERARQFEDPGRAMAFLKENGSLARAREDQERERNLEIFINKNPKIADDYGISLDPNSPNYYKLVGTEHAYKVLTGLSTSKHAEDRAAGVRGTLREEKRDELDWTEKEVMQDNLEGEGTKVKMYGYGEDLKQVHQAVVSVHQLNNTSSQDEIVASIKNLQTIKQAQDGSKDFGGVMSIVRKKQGKSVDGAIAYAKKILGQSAVRDLAETQGVKSDVTKWSTLMTDPSLQTDTATQTLESELRADILAYRQMAASEGAKEAAEAYGVSLDLPQTTLGELAGGTDEQLATFKKFRKHKAQIMKLQQDHDEWSKLGGKNAATALGEAFSNLMPGLMDAKFMKEHVESLDPGIMGRGNMTADDINNLNSSLQKKFIQHFDNTWGQITADGTLRPGEFSRAVKMLEGMGGEEMTIETRDVIDRLRREANARRVMFEDADDKEYSVFLPDTVDNFFSSFRPNTVWLDANGNEMTWQEAVGWEGTETREENFKHASFGLREDLVHTIRTTSLHADETTQANLDVRRAFLGAVDGTSFRAPLQKATANFFNVLANNKGLSTPYDMHGGQPNTDDLDGGIKDTFRIFGMAENVDQNMIDRVKKSIKAAGGAQSKDVAANANYIWRAVLDQVPQDKLAAMFPAGNKSTTWNQHLREVVSDYGARVIQSSIDETSATMQNQYESIDSVNFEGNKYDIHGLADFGGDTQAWSDHHALQTLGAGFGREADIKSRGIVRSEKAIKAATPYSPPKPKPLWSGPDEGSQVEAQKMREAGFE